MSTITDKIRKVVELAKFKESAKDSLEQSFAMMKNHPKFQEIYSKNFKWEDFIDIIVPHYEKHFTETELDSIIAFYESEVGQKIMNFNEESEGMNESVNYWLKENYNNMMSDLSNEIKQ
jgi:hypothetical protein